MFVKAFFDSKSLAMQRSIALPAFDLADMGLCRRRGLQTLKQIFHRALGTTATNQHAVIIVTDVAGQSQFLRPMPYRRPETHPLDHTTDPNGFLHGLL